VNARLLTPINYLAFCIQSVCMVFLPRTCAGEVPRAVQLKVVEADPYAKGDSATTSYKQCRLESGATIGVPPYIQVRMLDHAA
jgi:hypothetical protein